MYNRISRYMYCFYSEETKEFKKIYNSLQKDSLYINDHLYMYETAALYDSHIFALINIDKTFDFDTSLQYLRTYEMYEDDYEIDYSRHMIVFKLRPFFVQSLKHFRNSSYGDMYPEDYVEKYFAGSKKYCVKYRGKALDIESCRDVYATNLSMEEIFKDLTVSPYAVLTKNEDLREMLCELYGIELDMSVDLDSPISEKDEIYRYSETLVEE